MRTAILACLAIQSLCAPVRSPPPKPPGPPAIPALYVVNSGVCELDYAKDSATQTCSLGDTPLEGNMLRAGFVWSGSVRGSVDIGISAAEREQMRVSAGQYSDNSLVSISSCPKQDACAPLTFTVSQRTFKDAAQLSVKLGWAILSHTEPKPASDNSPSPWTSSPEFIGNYVAIGVIILVPFLAYALPRIIKMANVGSNPPKTSSVRYMRTRRIRI